MALALVGQQHAEGHSAAVYVDADADVQARCCLTNPPHSALAERIDGQGAVAVVIRSLAVACLWALGRPSKSRPLEVPRYAVDSCHTANSCVS